MPFSLTRLTCALLLFLGACNISLATQSDECSSLKPAAQNIVEEIKPDHRLEIFDISVSCTDNHLVFSGESSSFHLIKELKEKASKAYPNAQIQVGYTPETNDFNGKWWGLINTPVASLNAQPKFTSSVVTQAVMGTPIRLLKRSNPWVLVQTPDGYTGWIHLDQFQALSAEELGKWNGSQLLVALGPATMIANRSGQPQGLLPTGSVVKSLRFTDDEWLVELPSGHKAYLPATNVEFLSFWLKDEKKALQRNPALFKENLVKSAAKLLGTSYVWGGTTSFGVDCSGFISALFRANGLIVPRDSDLQAGLAGEILNRNKLEKGDLVFFGKKDKDSFQVEHVGIYAGDSQFIHSLGAVKRGSFNPKAPNYDGYETNRFLFGLRLPENITMPNCIEWLSDSPFYSITPHESELCRPKPVVLDKTDS